MEKPELDLYIFTKEGSMVVIIFILYWSPLNQNLYIYIVDIGKYPNLKCKIYWFFSLLNNSL